MYTMFQFGIIMLGLVGLWFGSDYAVEAARSVARKLGVSDLVIGLTVTSIGTSLPEIFTNVIAALNTAEGVDSSGIAVGNIIGSDLAQITLLLGIAGYIATLTIPRKALKRDGTMLFTAALLMFATALDGYVSRIEGVLLVAAYLAYLAYLFHHEHRKSVKDKVKRDYNVVADVAKSMVGLVVVVVSADAVVSNGVSIAMQYGVAASVIGLFVGLGTSIPELTVSLKAISKKAGKLSLGNLIDNAIKYTRPKGHVRAGAEVVDGRARLWVADDGPGLASDELETVFDRFHRGRAAADGEVSGSGLGLAIVRAVAAAHGGRAWAEPCEVGSRFVIELPLEGPTYTT